MSLQLWIRPEATASSPSHPGPPLLAIGQRRSYDQLMSNFRSVAIEALNLDEADWDDVRADLLRDLAAR